MAANRQKRVRAIPPYVPAGAPERAASQETRYVADLDGQGPLAHWVIRDGETGAIVEHCHRATKSEVADRAEQLNRGTPTIGDNRSWGRLTRPQRRVKEPAALGQLSATEWVERLVSDPMGETSAVLRKYVTKARGGGLDLDGLRRLLCKVGYQRDFSESLLEAISKKLERYFAVRRAQGDRRTR